MRKRVYNDWITSAFHLFIGLLCLIISGLIALPVLLLSGRASITLTIIVCILFVPFFISGIYCIILTFVKGFDYWYVTKNAIHYKRPFRRKIVIKFDNIESVKHTTSMNTLNASKYSPDDVFIVSSKGKQIIISANEEGRRKSHKLILIELKKTLSKYST